MKLWVNITLIIVANLLCIAVLSIPILLVNGYAAPHIRGFDPEDPTIALPFKPNTFSGAVAVVGAVLIFMAALFPIEYYVAYQTCKRNNLDEEESHTNCSRLSKIAFRTIVPIFIVFWAGLALTGLLTDIIKYMVARPRPCFLHMCQPNYTVLSEPGCYVCGSGSNPSAFWPMCPGCPYLNVTQAQAVCIGIKDSEFDDWWSLKDMWLSFPSGHTSYTFFAMAYLAAYIQRRLSASRFISQFLVALRPLLMFASLVFALIVGLSRVSDNRHRFSDVFGGFVIGAGVGVWSFLCVTAKAIYPNASGLAQSASAKFRDSDQATQTVEAQLAIAGNLNGNIVASKSAGSVGTGTTNVAYF